MPMRETVELTAEEKNESSDDERKHRLTDTILHVSLLVVTEFLTENDDQHQDDHTEDIGEQYECLCRIHPG